MSAWSQNPAASARGGRNSGRQHQSQQWQWQSGWSGTAASAHWDWNAWSWNEADWIADHAPFAEWADDYYQAEGGYDRIAWKLGWMHEADPNRQWTAVAASAGSAQSHPYKSHGYQL